MVKNIKHIKQQKQFYCSK